MLTKLNLTVVIIVFFMTANNLLAGEIYGLIKSKNSNETLIGATIRIDDTPLGAYSGLDGSYRIKNIKPGNHTVIFSYVGYKEIKRNFTINEKENVKVDFLVEEEDIMANEVFVFASRDLSTETSARLSERQNISVSNIISSKAIEISPDINVSSVIRKMPGLTIEEEGSNEGSYAIIRGMDKRYNNTLINGIKIPSPDARNRFVPLDIFPSDIIERVEVYKSVTPEMEADAIGGSVNLVMKNAPDKFLLQTNAAVGYNDLFFDYSDFSLSKSYLSFSTDVQSRKSPGRITEWSENLSKEDKYNIIQKNFPLEASVFSRKNASPNAMFGLTVGDRFFRNKRMGVIFAASYQSISRGQHTASTNIDPERETGLTILDNVYVRENSMQESRLALHNKIDYSFNANNTLSLYNAFMRLSQDEAWYMIDSSYFRLAFVRTVDYELLSHQIDQNIYNSTLRGDHKFSDLWKLDWSAAYSIATRNQPDRAVMRLNRKDVNDLNVNGDIRVDYDYQYVREFIYNYDQDLAFYSNITNKSSIFGKNLENKFGGMFRYKDRETDYDEYTFRPYLNNSGNEYPGNQEYVYRGDVINGDIRDTYFRLFNPNGSLGSTNSFSISEIVAAGYYQAKLNLKKLEITAGARAEYTQTAFETAAYKDENSPSNTKGDNDYLNVLPGVFFKYMPFKNTNLRMSYNQAMARPSFYEFVPAIELNSDGEQFEGNPELKNTISDNFDLRYEYFPNSLDKIFVGLFYKHLNNPIERAYKGSGTFTFENYEEANNFGFEFEFTKFINQFGLRANYSYTNSQMESQKRFYFRLTEETDYLIDEDVSGRLKQDVAEGNVGYGDLTNILRNQNRPLQGQTDHIFNISLLYKNQNIGFDAQFDFNYTGERISFVAREYELDWWQRPQIILDFSAEKKIGDFTIYFKARNLLDTPREYYVKRPLIDLGVDMPFQDNPDEETFARRNLYGRNIQLGFKYLFN